MRARSMAFWWRKVFPPSTHDQKLVNVCRRGFSPTTTIRRGTLSYHERKSCRDAKPTEQRIRQAPDRSGDAHYGGTIYGLLA